MTMPPHEAIPHLERFRDEASMFQRETLLARDLRCWYDDVLETLIHIFGQESKARREFEQIRFGFPPETFQRGSELLEADLRRRGIHLPDALTIPLAAYYQEPLRQAEEFLSSWIAKLKDS